MKRAGFLAVLVLAVAAVAVPARPIPLIGEMALSMAWSPGTPPRGATVTFTTTASDNDGAVRVAQLCFGDGSPCQGDSESLSPLDLALACVFGSYWDRTWQHKYTSAGTFTARLTITTRGCPGMDDETQSYSPRITVT